uniref:Coatomer subunit gamma n=1 Tax=Tetraselmis sp. GSL018 TaxID=582737 RepID=A0A061RA30_9CHLO|mmetsp:Transcript_5579/g.13577  ORF Transcript_5579/g.13577 Transcript_5579/m.13577 type:complete len:891 (+) Transcript_5579:233-2905(+)|eukprot:CAMPEP_0177616834 /NCGR_PEP_ID=MMETSP0419_2-20121207/24441_1 /TAXON_ID=582737 /ORGANISM="Tetraselmis sp., Strain GSL018" /LENGTH=890 /DNA_ID=CAMNT_0019115067 /DNA_START=195 /DNA_END=2867 /DNA_ORIENTATION=+
MASTAQDPQAPLRAQGEGKKEEERDEDLEYSPFFGIEKGAVLQESRIFHDREIDPRRCQQVITKLLYLLTQGESFTKKEASEVFFAVTKLFQNKDVNLRRMVFLVIKDICPGADEVIIVTSSLMKDMNSKIDLYRSNAIRVICKITDSQLLAQIERYIKQAVVDKSAVVSSASLVSGLQLLGTNTDIVKRWTNEVQEAVQSKHSMVQFHAVALLHALRQNDRLAISKLVSSLTRSSVRSPLAQCLLVRYVSEVIGESQAGSGGEERPFYDFLEGCLRHKSEMVIFEAARAITSMNNVTTRELTPAITVLQLFLSSSKPVLRFAAVRTLNKVAMTHPMAVTNCNIDMESLIGDQNRSIATLAITTLLKTGNESSVERLLKQIGNFMSEIADEFKIVVVEAIRSLCLKFPQKYRALMNFLSGILREEGGFEYKKAIVDAILALIREIPDAKESGLGHLCEFIEDCEFTYLSTQILHLLGSEGPKTSEPSKYIRYIYNRIILENATVRAAAVSSLAKFGAEVESLRPRVMTLLRRALHDNDDEVRDRATVYLRQLQGLAGGPNKVHAHMDLPVKNLEACLKYYASNPSDEPFDLAVVPGEVQQPHRPAAKTKGTKAEQAAQKKEPVEDLAAKMIGIPEIAACGKLFKSSEPQKLTEEETEYIVTCVKHVFESHIVFQFNCTNTIREQVLENVSVTMDLADADDFEEEAVVPLPLMPYDGSGQTYVILARPTGAMSLGKFVNILRFTVKEVDPSTGEAEEDGYEDEYQLEDIEVVPANYIKATSVANFRKSWEELDSATEREDDYGLGQRDSLQEAVEAVIGILGMQPCEGTDAVPPNSRSHTVLLSGTFVGYQQVLVRMQFGIDAGSKVAMKLSVRAASDDVSEIVHQIIQEA